MEGVDIPVDIKRNNEITKSLTFKTSPCHIHRISSNSIQITLNEGKNQQIRKMAYAVNLDVQELHRTRFGPITLENLSSPGEWSYLNSDELKFIADRLRGSVVDQVGCK